MFCWAIVPHSELTIYTGAWLTVCYELLRHCRRSLIRNSDVRLRQNVCLWSPCFFHQQIMTISYKIRLMHSIRHGKWRVYSQCFQQLYMQHSSGKVPAYLASLLIRAVPAFPRAAFHTGNNTCWHMLTSKTGTDSRAFTNAPPKIWNYWPLPIKLFSLDAFKRSLKTNLLARKHLSPKYFRFDKVRSNLMKQKRKELRW